MLYRRLVVIVDGDRGVIKGRQQIGPDIADLSGIVPEAVKDILHVAAVQPLKTVPGLLRGNVLAPDADGRPGGAEHIRDELHHLVHILPVELGAEVVVFNALSHLSRNSIYPSIQPSPAGWKPMDG